MEQTGQEEVQRRFLRLVAISNQAGNDIDESVDRAVMTGMLNLRDVTGKICFN